MEANEVHRGRLIDHERGVRGLEARRRFYAAVLAARDVPVGGAGEDWLWADALFVSTAGSLAAQGALTGRHHLALQARDPAMVAAFHAAAMANGGRDDGAPGTRAYHPAATPRSRWARTATTSRRCTTARRNAACLRC